MTDAGIAEDGFAALAHPTRLGILQALTEQLRDPSADPTVGFSDLRRAVGMRDSGNFDYHLDELRGRFVRQTDEGYRITAAGLQVVGAAIAGVYDASDLDPAPIGSDCPLCGEPQTATYENGLLRVACPNAHEFKNPLPPGSVDDRNPEELVDLVTVRTRQNLELAVRGICPICDAKLSWSVGSPTASEYPEFSTQCRRCGMRVEVPVTAVLHQHPGVIAFYHDHGIDVRRRPLWAPEFYSGVTVEYSTDPLRIAVTLELDGDALTATLDETLTILAVDSDPAGGA